jgi:hypothetical protein
MGARKLDKCAFKPVLVESQRKHLTLSPDAVCIRKSGIDFLASEPLTQWTEMTVDLQSPRDGKRIRCQGVVVACDGNSHSGYTVSMLFTNLTRQSEAVLNQLAFVSSAHLA